MNRLLLTLPLLILLTHPCCSQPDSLTSSALVPAHPRLLLLAGEERRIEQSLKTNSDVSNVHQAIMQECRALDTVAPLKRIVTGRRLLDVSREALRRVFFLAYAYRMTRQPSYLKRAETELLTVSAFSDWNPAHFLDVAEMTMAVAIGYDWLYNDLQPATRAILSEAILKKGLEPSLNPKHSSWLRASHNWNQVCNAGMAFGALALYDEQPHLARSLVNRAIRTIVLPMSEYAPDGAYPEGHSYWGYGTGFNVLFISALETLFKTDFGLSKQPGFLQTAGYVVNMVGPGGIPFNYSDASAVGGDAQPALFWFAAETKNPSLLWAERNRLLKTPANRFAKNRLLPALPIWNAAVPSANSQPPTPLLWVGQGKNPVALMRSSWTDSTAIYVGLKAGSPAVNHAHMDVGSFVMDAGGVRWAMDFGMQNYNSLESKGVDIWGREQTAQRWRVFRYNNLTHNTLTVNGELQKADGYASITHWGSQPSFVYAATDISALYPTTLTSAKRGIAIVDKAYVLVRDELTAKPAPVTAPSAASTVRWTMLTAATVTLLGGNRAELTKDGRKLIVTVLEPASATLKTWSTDPPNPYDAPNPGTTLLGFEVSVPAATQTAFTVLLQPQPASASSPAKLTLPLEQWHRR